MKIDTNTRVMEIKLLGSVIGTASDMDFGDVGPQYYDYAGPITELRETTCFSFDVYEGVITVWSDDGEVVNKYNVANLLAVHGLLDISKLKV